MKQTRTDIQIRFADCDILQHINNVNLQHYFDLGKNDYSQRVFGVGVTFDRMGMITARTETDYLSQTRLYDKIHVTTTVERIGQKSVTFFQRIVAEDGQVRAESRSVLVAYDFERQCTVPVPEGWRKAAEE